MSRKNFKPTKNGYKEVDEEEELKKTVPTKAQEKEIEKLVDEKLVEKKETPLGAKLENAENMDIPYPELGHTVSQLSQFQEHKRKAILGAKDAEFCKKYHL